MRIIFLTSLVVQKHSFIIGLCDCVQNLNSKNTQSLMLNFSHGREGKLWYGGPCEVCKNMAPALWIAWLWVKWDLVSLLCF